MVAVANGLDVQRLRVHFQLTSYIETIEQWRRAREESLKAPDGWLRVAGLHWLEEGENHLEGLTFIRRGAAVWHDGKLLQPDAPGPADLVDAGGKTLFVIVRGSKVGLRVRDAASPFLRDFRGLRWYPVRPEFRVAARWAAYLEPERRLLDTVIDGFEEEYRSPGAAEFNIGGVACQLEAMLSGNRLFFLFRDLTSGKTTYGASRFLYADLPENGKVVLDFNKAYNPPCAFTRYATCPLPPASNWLPVAIEAGELVYSSTSAASM